MLNWFKNGRYTTYIIFTFSYIITMTCIFFSLYLDMESWEVHSLINLFHNDGPPAFAVIGIVILFTLFFGIIQLFIGSTVFHLIAKFIFKIPVSFQLFQRIFFIFTAFLSISAVWQIALFKDKIDFLSVVINPILLLGMAILFWLLKISVNVNQLKPLLFTVFCFASYLIFVKCYLGGI